MHDDTSVSGLIGSPRVLLGRGLILVRMNCLIEDPPIGTLSIRPWAHQGGPGRARQ